MSDRSSRGVSRTCSTQDGRSCRRKYRCCPAQWTAPKLEEPGIFLNPSMLWSHVFSTSQLTCVVAQSSNIPSKVPCTTNELTYILSVMEWLRCRWSEIQRVGLVRVMVFSRTQMPFTLCLLLKQIYLYNVTLLVFCRFGPFRKAPFLRAPSVVAQRDCHAGVARAKRIPLHPRVSLYSQDTFSEHSMSRQAWHLQILLYQHIHCTIS